MHLSPQEIDKLTLHQAGTVAQKRLARGLRLNYPEAMALIATQILELVRDGRTVAEVMDLGRRMLGRNDVMDGVAEMLDEVQVEGTFPDGTKLVTVHHPIAAERGDLELALYGSFLPVPIQREASGVEPAVPGGAVGEMLPGVDEIVLNAGRDVVDLVVTNTGDRPVQVGSHYHFIETNRALRFDRAKAYGMRLDIPAGTAVRFEPGESRPVRLVAIAGARIIRGGNALATGEVSEALRQKAAQAVRDGGFGDTTGA